MVAQLWNRMPKPSAVILDSQLVKQTTGHRTFLEAHPAPGMDQAQVHELLEDMQSKPFGPITTKPLAPKLEKSWRDMHN